MTQSAGTNGTNEAGDLSGEPSDVVAAAVARVEKTLAGLRSEGKLPQLPAGELDRQFQGVVESVEAQLIAAPRVDVQAVTRSSDYLSGGRQGATSGSFPRRMVVKAVSTWLKLILPRLGRFAGATAEAVEQLADRQDHIQELVVSTQLDRIRSLEYRCGQLELEVERIHGSEAPRG